MTSVEIDTTPIVEHEHNDNMWVTVRTPRGLLLQQCAVGGEINMDILDSSIGNTWQAQLVQDMDRCPHGRHEGEACAGWVGPGLYDSGCYGGVSAGFPKRATGQLVAYGLVAERDWIMPAPGKRHEPEQWRRA